MVTCGRYYLRWRHFGTAKWDDLLNGLALASLIAYVAANNEANITDDGILWEKRNITTSILMWTTLYLVKGAFLSLFWSIFSVSSSFRKAWWFGTVYTFLTFWPIVLSEFWKCGYPINYNNDPGPCTYPTLFVLPVLSFRFALHITSEIWILLLPMAQIKKLHLSRTKKISISAVFLLITIDIVVGIIRNATSVCMAMQPVDYDGAGPCGDVNLILEMVEPALAVIVCALPVYRVLLPSSRRKKRHELEELQRNAASIGESPPTPPFSPKFTETSTETQFSSNETQSSQFSLSPTLVPTLRPELPEISKFSSFDLQKFSAGPTLMQPEPVYKS